MRDIIEKERKYLVTDVKKNTVWDYEFIIYQWYTTVTNGKSVKNKILFDFLRQKIIYVKISKEVVTLGNNKKNVEYLDINKFEPEKFLGIPFVLKRRAVKGKTFLDRFLASNGICKYLLEIEEENDSMIIEKQDEFHIVKDVTEDEKYYNQNMCIEFNKKHMDELKVIMSMFLL